MKCRGVRRQIPSDRSAIGRREFKNIAEEGTIRFGISTVKQEMRADNHAAEYIRISAECLTKFAAALKIETGQE